MDCSTGHGEQAHTGWSCSERQETLLCTLDSCSAPGGTIVAPRHSERFQLAGELRGGAPCVPPYCVDSMRLVSGRRLGSDRMRPTVALR